MKGSSLSIFYNTGKFRPEKYDRAERVNRSSKMHKEVLDYSNPSWRVLKVQHNELADEIDLLQLGFAEEEDFTTTQFG